MVAALSKSGVSDLISCNGDVNQADFLGRTPLHYAAGNGNVALMELLLEEGAGVECAFRFNHVVAMTDEGRWNALLAKVEDLQESSVDDDPLIFSCLLQMDGGEDHCMLL